MVLKTLPLAPQVHATLSSTADTDCNAVVTPDVCSVQVPVGTGDGRVSEYFHIPPAYPVAYTVN